MLFLPKSAMGGTVAEAEAALGADLNHVASGRLVCAAQGIDSIYVLHFFLFLRLDYNQVILKSATYRV